MLLGYLLVGLNGLAFTIIGLWGFIDTVSAFNMFFFMKPLMLDSMTLLMCRALAISLFSVGLMNVHGVVSSSRNARKMALLATGWLTSLMSYLCYGVYYSDNSKLKQQFNPLMLQGMMVYGIINLVLAIVDVYFIGSPSKPAHEKCY